MFIVMTSLLTIVVENFSTISMPLNPNLIRIIRILRIARGFESLFHLFFNFIFNFFYSFFSVKTIEKVQRHPSPSYNRQQFYIQNS